MTQTIVSIISSIIVLIIGVVISFVVSLFKRAILDAMDKISVKITELETKINSMQLNVEKDFQRKDEASEKSLENTLAHKELWEKVNHISERVAKLEK